MPKPLDLSDYSLDDLSSLIDEATKLRAEKVEARKQELRSELDAKRKEVEAELAKLGAPTSGPRLPAGLSEGRKRVARFTYRHPKTGDEWPGKGGVKAGWEDILDKGDVGDVRKEKLTPYRKAIER
ncbi:hypothetical protein ACSBOB_19965 [Mesorhizobium sp. ASY16-5R]|uniref:hypothetical protein n=1 Tax=Mesorhizobium sp. ASY16-5R TaxID=3445772 RepID=UPI003F9FDB8F